MHRKLPIIGRAISYNAFNREPELKAYYYINTESLLEWDGWKSLAKKKLKELKNLSFVDRFIEHKSPNISITQLITDHRKDVVSFYKWLVKKRKEWHIDDIQKVRNGLKNTDYSEVDPIVRTVMGLN